MRVLLARIAISQGPSLRGFQLAVLALLAGVLAPLSGAQAETVEAYSSSSDLQQEIGTFGYDLHVDGNRAIVGSLSDDVSPDSWRGAAYFLKHENGRWVHEQVVRDAPTPSGPGRPRYWMSDISGNRAVISTRSQIVPGPLIYRLHVFEYSDQTGWVHSEDLPVPIIHGPQLVARLQLEGNLLTFVVRGGKVVTYRHDGVAWRRLRTYKPDFLPASTLSYWRGPLYYRKGDILFTNHGHVPTVPFQFADHEWQLSRLIGDRWHLVDTFPYPEDILYPSGGSSVVTHSIDADGDWLMFGEQRFPSGRSKVVVMRRNMVTGSYGFHSVILPSLSAHPTGSSDRFGEYSALDLEGDRLIVGAPGSASDWGTEVGRAFTFHYDEGQDRWVEDQVLMASEARDAHDPPLSNFGISVAYTPHGPIVTDRLATNDQGIRTRRAYYFE